MKPKFGAVVVAGRGGLGNYVFSKNHYGPFIRTKSSKEWIDTDIRIATRLIHKTVCDHWYELTHAQMLAWNAAAPTFFRKDIFGDHRPLSGFNLFCKLNNFLLQFGKDQIDVPPLPVFIDPFISLSIVAAEDPAKVEITYSPEINDDLYGAQLWVTKPISPGIINSKGHFFYLMPLAAAQASPFDFNVQYEARVNFSLTGSEGKKIFVRLRMVNIITGQPGAYIFAWTIVQ